MDQINAIENLSLEDDMSYFEAKIKNKKLYVASLMTLAVQRRMDPVKFVQSISDNVYDLIDAFIMCMNKLKKQGKSPACAGSPQSVNTRRPISPPSSGALTFDAAPKASSESVSTQTVSDALMSAVETSDASTSPAPIISDALLSAAEISDASTFSPIAPLVSDASTSSLAASKAVDDAMSTAPLDASTSAKTSDASASSLAPQAADASMFTTSKVSDAAFDALESAATPIISGVSTSLAAANATDASMSTAPKVSAALRFAAASEAPKGISAARMARMAVTTFNRGPLDAPALALRDAENQCSIVIMNLAEPDALEDAERRQSDLDDVVTILNSVELAWYIRNLMRYTPTQLPPGRPPFLKVCFASGEVKKKVLETLLTNLSHIRSLEAKFAQVAFCDPVKTAKGADNNINNSSPSYIPGNGYRIIVPRQSSTVDSVDAHLSPSDKPATSSGGENSKQVKFYPAVQVNHYS